MAILVQIRGTSGSGKSTAMRRVMAGYGDSLPVWEPFFIEGRKRPLGYKHKEVVVLGHYEIACGGCDTIGSVPEVFAAMEKVPPCKVLLSEGLLLSEDVIWSLKIRPTHDVRPYFLITDSEECLKRVGLRQEEKGKPPADPERVRRKLTTRVGTIERARLRLVSAGVEVRRCSADQAPGLILDLIKGVAP